MYLHETCLSASGSSEVNPEPLTPNTAQHTGKRRPGLRVRPGQHKHSTEQIRLSQQALLRAPIPFLHFFAPARHVLECAGTLYICKCIGISLPVYTYI